MSGAGTSNVAAIPIGGRWRHTGEAAGISSPHDGRLVAEVALASAEDIEDALAAAASAAAAARATAPEVRAAVLAEVARRLAEERETLAWTIALQTGKPVRHARAEVDRSARTCATAAEEAMRAGAAVVPAQWATADPGRTVVARRVPRGTVLGLASVAAPLEVPARQLVAAIAAGCPIVLRPPMDAPTPALQLAYLVLDAGWVAGAVSVVTALDEDLDPYLADPRVRSVLVAGLAAEGDRLRRLAWQAAVTLEPEGSAAVLIGPDVDDAALDRAAERIVAAAVTFQGQGGLRVGRVLAVGGVADALRERLLARLETLEMGDPLQEETHLGPMLSPEAADRVHEAVAAAVAAAGGDAPFLMARDGQTLSPALLEGVPAGSEVLSPSFMGPVICLSAFDRWEDALRAADGAADIGAAAEAARSALPVGLFTHDLRRVQSATQSLAAPAVVVNDVPTWSTTRGRDGIPALIEAITEPRLLTLASG